MQQIAEREIAEVGERAAPQVCHDRVYGRVAGLGKAGVHEFVGAAGGEGCDQSDEEDWAAELHTRARLRGIVGRRRVLGELDRARLKG